VGVRYRERGRFEKLPSYCRGRSNRYVTPFLLAKGVERRGEGMCKLDLG